MKRIVTTMAFMVFAGLMVSSLAVQEVTLRETPPLQPLHWCQGGDGNVNYQNEPCGAGTTEVSSIGHRGEDGKMHMEPLEKKDAPAVAVASASAPGNPPAADSKAVMHDFWIRIAKWCGFALVVGLIGAVLKRSFILWFILGFILRMLLVAANLMAF